MPPMCTLLLPALLTASEFQSQFKETYASPLTVKREAVYEFAQKPVVTRPARDRVEITFASKGWCDATVAVEDAQGRIVRYLASGVLGPRAPEPFQKDSLSQKIVWDGKNDKGEYIDDKESHSIRVSLGLKPQFERTLYYSPFKRYGALGNIVIRTAFPMPLLAGGTEGFYVHDEHGDETIRLYDRNGDYVRTIYPFPADKVDQVKMPRRTYPDGLSVPAKRGYFLATLLTGRENGQASYTARVSSEATAIHVRGTRLALTGFRLNRMTTDGTSGGLDLYGPVVQGPSPATGHDYTPKQPHALAFSPDGKYLYLTAYEWSHNDISGNYSFGHWAHGVLRMEYAKDDPPQVFLGKETERGSDDAHFDHPVDVATDDAGRLYVADHVNNRVQIFSPEGKLLKSLAVEGPAKVSIHEKTQELYVFSYFIGRDYRAPRAIFDADIKPLLRVFAPLPGLEPRQSCPLPLRGYRTTTGTNGPYSRTNLYYQFALASGGDPPRILAILEEGANPELLELRKEGLVKVRDFLDDAKKSGVRPALAGTTRQRMFVDPRTGLMYLSEGDCALGKAFTRLLRIDPATGQSKVVELPFSAEDAAFGRDGTIYLRTGKLVGRYNLESGKEVPFDYGEEREANFNYDARVAGLVGALRLPSVKIHHFGGMDVNVKGDLLVTCYNPNSVRIKLRKEEQDNIKGAVVGYRPVFYPGRPGFAHEMHVWDEHGLIKHEDVVKGQTLMVAGVGLDANDNIYANVSVSLMYDGQPYFKVVGHRFDQVGTLAKFKPAAGKFYTRDAFIPLQNPPDRPPELNGFWVDGAEWFYPGVGRTNWTMDCTCRNSRIALDYFARTFAPEYDRFSIAVLDTNGNLITRVGRYGNIEDGKPLIAAGGPPTVRSIGGDEVALFDAAYVATYTDRRVFIADAGNARILSVRLHYHATERVALKDVPDAGRLR